MISRCFVLPHALIHHHHHLKCAAVQGLVKPDIVFFGEDLHPRFYSLKFRDFAKCDLLIIMGTSLEVSLIGEWGNG